MLYDIFGDSVAANGDISGTGTSKSQRAKRRKIAKEFEETIKSLRLPPGVQIHAFGSEYWQDVIDSGRLPEKALATARSCASSTKSSQDPICHPMFSYVADKDHYEIRESFWDLADELSDKYHPMLRNVERRFYEEFSRKTRPAFKSWAQKVVNLYEVGQPIGLNRKALNLAVSRVIDEMAMMIDWFDPEESREWVTKEWSRRDRRYVLKPVTDPEKLIELSRKETNSGMAAYQEDQFCARWVKKGNLRDYAIQTAALWLSGGEPARISMQDNDLWMLFARSKDEEMDGGKEARPVICPPLADKMAGKAITEPIIALFQWAAEQGICTKYAGFRGGERMQETLHRDGITACQYWAELDWKSFDANCASLLPMAVTVVKTMVPEQFHSYLDLDLEWAMSAKILTPIGVLSSSGVNAMPSGWSKTSIYGTICSRIAIEYICIRAEQGAEARQEDSPFAPETFYCFGDDVLMASKSELDFHLAGEFAKELGMVINTKKCNQTEMFEYDGEGNEYDGRLAAFLGYYHYANSVELQRRGYFPLMRMAPKFFWAERYTVYPEDSVKKMSVLDLLSRLEVLSHYEDEDLMDVVRLVMTHAKPWVTKDLMRSVSGSVLTEEQWEIIREARSSRKILEMGINAWNSTHILANWIQLNEQEDAIDEGPITGLPEEEVELDDDINAIYEFQLSFGDIDI